MEKIQCLECDFVFEVEDLPGSYSPENLPRPPLRLLQHVTAHVDAMIMIAQITGVRDKGNRLPIRFERV